MSDGGPGLFHVAKRFVLYAFCTTLFFLFIAATRASEGRRFDAGVFILAAGFVAADFVRVGRGLIR